MSTNPACDNRIPPLRIGMKVSKLSIIYQRLDERNRDLQEKHALKRKLNEPPTRQSCRPSSIRPRLPEPAEDETRDPQWDGRVVFR